MKEIKINTEYIKLDQFLKWIGISENGVEAKYLIQEKQVLVNGEVETRRGKKLRQGDVVQFSKENYKII